MKRFNSEKLIQNFKNLKKSYFKDLSEEELDKINEVEDIVKNGKDKSYFLFFRIKQEELAKKRIRIFGRSCEILYQILRNERAYQNNNFKEVKELILNYEQSCYI